MESPISTIILRIRTIPPDNCPLDNSPCIFPLPRHNCPQDNSPRRQLPPGQLPPRQIAPQTIAPPPRTITPWTKYPQKTAPYQFPTGQLPLPDNCPPVHCPSPWRISHLTSPFALERGHFWLSASDPGFTSKAEFNRTFFCAKDGRHAKQL